MSAYSFRSSRPDRWVSPRPYTDADHRVRAYGRIEPMERPGLAQRVLGRLFARR